MSEYSQYDAAKLTAQVLLENNNPSLAPHSLDMTSLCSLNCCCTKPLLDLLNSAISSCSLLISFWSESLSRTSWQIPVEISKRPEYCSASTVLLKRSSLAKRSVPFLFEQYKFLSRWRRRRTWLDFSLYSLRSVLFRCSGAVAGKSPLMPLWLLFEISSTAASFRTWQAMITLTSWSLCKFHSAEIIITVRTPFISNVHCL